MLFLTRQIKRTDPMLPVGVVCSLVDKVDLLAFIEVDRYVKR